MNFNQPQIEHAWDLNKEEAIRLQKNLAARVIARDHVKSAGYVAGVDAAYDETDKRQFAVAVVLDAEAPFSMVEYATANEPVRNAYVPGLFAFRELPAIIRALKKLKTTPDLIVVDGHGRAHPRRFGLACHLGVMFEVPTIGCSKSPLIGTATEPGPHRGDDSPLLDKGETIGRVLRTQDNVNPLIVSVGHLISLPTACQWILKLAPRYRLPETTRAADQICKRMKRDNKHDATP